MKNNTREINILTFDIEDWFHTHQNRHQYSGHIWDRLPPKIVPNTNRILDMLDRHELKATFFILGWVAKREPALVRKIQAGGHEIGAHSFWHHNPHQLSLTDFEKDLKLCLDTLQDITGEKVTAYRAPGFNLKRNDTKYFDILASHGITMDSSVELSQMPRNIPVVLKGLDYEILEFPLVTTFFGLPYSGGGYFRALPFAYVKHLFKKQPYHLLYFHPRDFDSDCPSTNLFSFYRNRLNRFNTDRCMDKLEAVLKQVPTITLKEAAKLSNTKNL